MLKILKMFYDKQQRGSTNNQTTQLKQQDRIKEFILPEGVGQ